MTCPDCDRAAAYHADLDRTLVSLFGPIHYRRAYYYCRRCGQGYCPFDDQAGIPAHQLTPADGLQDDPNSEYASSRRLASNCVRAPAGCRHSPNPLIRCSE